MEIGLTLLSRGEFALILATMAGAAGLDLRIAPFAGPYVLTNIIALLASSGGARANAGRRGLARFSRTNADDRLTIDPLGRVESSDCIV